MKAARLHDHARGSASLRYEDAPEPTAGAGEVVIAVHAAAVTPTELRWLPTHTTQDGAPRPLPVIPGHEYSGTIAAVGAGVTDLVIGDAVYGLNDWYRDGAQAERCVARARELAAKPRSLSHVEAAVVPISALTAWQGLFEHAHLAAGQRVLVHGGSGGVGSFAVQLARWRGARVVATASAANFDLVGELGAEQMIDYKSERFEDVVDAVDVVFDTVGGETLERSWSVLARGGTLVTVAASEENAQAERNQRAFFIVEAKHDQLAEIARLIDDGVLRAVVGDVFPLAAVRDAYGTKPPHGKTVLRIVADGGGHDD